MLEFKVKKVYSGTENQKRAGIYATFGIDIVVDDNVVVSLADYKLCKSRDGAYYVQSPFREYEKKGDTSGAKQKIYFAKLLPNEQDGSYMTGIIEQVKRECESPSPRTNQKAPGNYSSNYNNSKAPANPAKSRANEDW